MWVFMPSEIAQIGMKIEENRMSFYRAIASEAKKKEAVEIFNFLASEKEQHYQTFKSLADKLRGCDLPTLDKDHEEFMRQLANSNILATCDDVVKYARSVKSTLEAIDLSLGFEKDSIIFYLQFKKMLPDSLKPEIDVIIDEEQKHIQKFLALRNIFATTAEEFYISKATVGNLE